MSASVLIAPVCAAVIGVPVSASAEANDISKSRLSDFSMELTESYAYYGILAHCAEGVSSEVVLGRNAADQRLLPLIYQTGKMAGLIDSALLGRIQLAVD